MPKPTDQPILVFGNRLQTKNCLLIPTVHIVRKWISDKCQAEFVFELKCLSFGRISSSEISFLSFIIFLITEMEKTDFAILPKTSVSFEVDIQSLPCFYGKYIFFATLCEDD